MANAMQVESSFRDLKSDRFGLGFSLTRTTRIDRLNILLLIGALATLCLWWLGLLARAKQWHLHFQANTVQHRNVLSANFPWQRSPRAKRLRLQFQRTDPGTSKTTRSYRIRPSTRLIRGDPSATKLTGAPQWAFLGRKWAPGPRKSTVALLVRRLDRRDSESRMRLHLQPEWKRNY